jgi:GT2 family glycosyltransferase
MRPAAEAGLDAVTVVFVTYNSAHILPQALATLEPPAPRIIVVDNGSTDGTLDCVCRLQPQAERIALGRNLGFGRANNVALERVQTPFALLLNPDCRLAAGAVPALLAAAARYPDAAILAPRLYDAPGRLGLCYRPSFFRAQPATLIDPDGDVCSEFLTGAAMLLRMDAMRQVGFFDPWFFLYCEDDDLCLRVRAAGHSLVLVHDASVLHGVKASSAPAPKLAFRRAYCRTASKIYALGKHVGPAACARNAVGALLGGTAGLLLALIGANRERLLAAAGRVAAAAASPVLLRAPHCLDSTD